MYSYKRDQEWKHNAGIEFTKLEYWKRLLQFPFPLFLKHLVVVATSDVREAYTRKRIEFERQCKRLRFLPEKVPLALPGFETRAIAMKDVMDRWTYVTHVPKKNGLSQVHAERWIEAFMNIHEWAIRMEAVSGIKISLEWLERLWFPESWEMFWKEARMYEETRLAVMAEQTGTKRKGTCAYCTGETDVYYRCPQCAGVFCCPECFYMDFWTRSEKFQKTEITCIACREPIDMSRLGYKKKNKYMASDAESS